MQALNWAFGTNTDSGSKKNGQNIDEVNDNEQSKI